MVVGDAVIASDYAFEKAVYSLLRLGVDWGVWGYIGASSAGGGVLSLLPGSSVWTTADTRVCCESPRIFAKEAGNASR